MQPSRDARRARVGEWEDVDGQDVLMAMTEVQLVAENELRFWGACFVCVWRLCFVLVCVCLTRS